MKNKDMEINISKIESIINSYSKTPISIEKIEDVAAIHSKLEIVENAFCIDVLERPVVFKDEKSILGFISDWNAKQADDEDLLVCASQIYKTDFCNFDGIAFSPSPKEFATLKEFSRFIDNVLELSKN